jgi:hypothetical protein
MLLGRGCRPIFSRYRLSAQQNQAKRQQAYDACQPVPPSETASIAVKHASSYFLLSLE